MRSEVSEKMVIPSIINVGFQNRSDTYTKKLAYVIYTDAKGKLRKQASWDGWRDKKIKPLEFKNEPMSGFVLNKKVGGHKSDWNFRNAYVRIYDPRDFEFEISVENLLFILQETSSIKGKGLEGEFVYAWHGKDLVLLPVETDSYKQCANFTKKQTQKVTKNDIKEGHTYLMKDMTNVMYLGKLPYCNVEGYSEKQLYVPIGNHHIFLNLDAPKGTDKYIALAGYTKLAELVSTDTAEYANKLTAYKKSPFYKIATGIQIVPKKIKASDFTFKTKWGESTRTIYAIEKVGEGYRPVILHKRQDQVYDYSTRSYKTKVISYKKHYGETYAFEFDGIGCELPEFQTHDYYHASENPSTSLTKEELEDSTFYTVELISNKGKEDILINGFKYYKRKK